MKYFNQSCRLLQQEVQKPECFNLCLEMGSVCKSQAASDF